MTPVNVLTWAATLLGFWLLLSGKLDAAHVAMGVLAVALALVASRPLLSAAPAIGPGVTETLRLRTAAALATYLSWLFAQVVVSSVQVAFVVLHPRLLIAPRVLRVRARLPHPLARLTFAQSITLTPGTVTLDLQGDEYVVHALTPSTARGLEAATGGSDMLRRVQAVFAGTGETAA